MATALPTRCVITPLGNKPGLLAISCHGWSGWIPSLQATPDQYRRIGETGTGSQSTGLLAPTVNCTAWRAEITTDNAIATIAAVENLTNEIVRILDPWGRTLARCRIWRGSAEPTKCKGPVVSGSSVGTVRVSMSFDVERLPDT